jgi:asparagine synthase (glutamine-hydrolysing)
VCGICGLLSLDGATPPDPRALRAMSAALAHRGPDGAGEHAEGPVALAARRLALVDRPGGHQPASGEDGSVRAMLNGELYDLHALRRRLAGRGHALATRSDTEALVHLYEDEGPGFVAGLRGMFALAVWDAPRRRLLLARDRFGIKPLLYAHVGSRLAFASELGALCALPDLRREVDLDALEAYLTVNAVHAPRTMLAGVCKLPPGHLLLADSAGVRVERYARDLPAAIERVRREPLRDLARETRERLRDSVRAHLVADVPVGVLLSGGVDSGGVAALAAQQHGPGLQTFTIGFRERSFDELSRARLVARRYATDHHELVVTAADAEALLPRLAQAFDEPRGDATALPYWLVARMAAGQVKAVLSGEGADELFGGYQTYAADLLGARAADVAAALAPALARWPSSSRRLSLDFRARRLARGAGLPALERHHAWKEILSSDARSALLERRGRADPLESYRARYAETAAAPPLARLQDIDLGTFLADDLLVQADRAGMAHGLEVRVPFLDPVVAELALALPTHARVRGLRTKRVLRMALSPLLPAEIVRGPKRGFVAPAAAWLRGELEPFARDVLAPATLRRQGFFRPAAVEALLDRHVARSEDLSRPLWALMTFTLWHDTWLRGVPCRPPEATVVSRAR